MIFISAIRRKHTEIPIIASTIHGIPYKRISALPAIPTIPVASQNLECEGLDRRRIVQEDVSVNTLENLKFSRNLIAGVDTPVGIVSNNFHVYRGCVYAKRAGFKEPFPIPASCHPLLFPNYFVRECFAVWKLWLKKY